jgi:hypothetical protein
VEKVWVLKERLQWRHVNRWIRFGEDCRLKYPARLKVQPSFKGLWYLQLGFGQKGGTLFLLVVFMPLKGRNHSRNNLRGTLY